MDIDQDFYPTLLGHVEEGVKDGLDIKDLPGFVDGIFDVFWQEWGPFDPEAGAVCPELKSTFESWNRQSFEKKMVGIDQGCKYLVLLWGENDEAFDLTFSIEQVSKMEPLFSIEQAHQIAHMYYVSMRMYATRRNEAGSLDRLLADCDFGPESD